MRGNQAGNILHAHCRSLTLVDECACGKQDKVCIPHHQMARMGVAGKRSIDRRLAAAVELVHSQ